MSDTTDKDTDFRLWRLLDHTRFVISRSREKELARFGMTPEQAHVLDILHQSGGKATIQEIVNITMRQHHSISTLVGRRAKQGPVKKNTGAPPTPASITSTSRKKDEHCSNPLPGDQWKKYSAILPRGIKKRCRKY